MLHWMDHGQGQMLHKKADSAKAHLKLILDKKSCFYCGNPWQIYVQRYFLLVFLKELWIFPSRSPAAGFSVEGRQCWLPAWPSMAHWLLPPGHLKVTGQTLSSQQPPAWQIWNTSCTFLLYSSRHLLAISPWPLESTAELSWTPEGTHQGQSKKSNTGKGRWGRQVLFWGEKEASTDKERRPLLSHQVTQLINMKSKNQWLLPRTKHSTHTGYWPKKSPQNSL